MVNRVPLATAWHPFWRDSPLHRLFGRSAPDTPPLRLGQRRLYILPTRFGWSYALLLTGLMIASANYGISLGYLFTFLLASVGMLAMFHTQRNLSGLLLSPGRPAPVFLGETAVLPLVIDNPSRLARHALALRAGGDTVHCDVAAHTRGGTGVPVPTMRRGLCPVGRLTLASTWPLGLFRCWSVFEFDCQIVVYPRPSDSQRPLPHAAGSGHARLTDTPGDDTFAGLRGYRPGDSPRHIAWKAVARGLSLQTKQFAGAPTGIIWLDWHDAEGDDPEARLSRLARWALQAEASGADWGMRLPGGEFAAARGSGHLHHCLHALAIHEPHVRVP